MPNLMSVTSCVFFGAQFVLKVTFYHVVVMGKLLKHNIMSFGFHMGSS